MARSTLRSYLGHRYRSFVSWSIIADGLTKLCAYLVPVLKGRHLRAPKYELMTYPLNVSLDQMLNLSITMFECSIQVSSFLHNIVDVTSRHS